MAYRCLLISDFNLDNLAGLLTYDEEEPRVEVIVAPYGQPVSGLIQRQGEWWQQKPHCGLVWTRPEGAIAAFGRRFQGEGVADGEILAEVDAFAELLRQAAGQLKALFVPTWEVPGWQRGYGPLDLRPGLGIGYALLQMNLRLADRLADLANVFVLDLRRWLEPAGDRAFQPRLWQLARIPFHRSVFVEAVRDLKAALRGLEGQARKLIALDLDDTLWGGIVGEVGWEGLRLGGHDPTGEAFLEFQRALKTLSRRGVLLAIVSRNEEQVALEAIARHPEMILRLEDFAGWRINWQDKAQNLADLVAELNLGLASVVFIDNDPVERARIRQALPEVWVPEWPAHPSLYASTLLGLRCFDRPEVSSEDRDRIQHYAAERQRREQRRQVPSLEEWLASLELKVRVEPLALANAPRAAQLLKRTNQMNLTGRRLTETELLAWVKGPGRECWVFSVADRFGDSGLTGLASLEQCGATGWIADFALSCRVMGRRVEEAMIYYLVQRARELGLREVCAECVPTAKNRPCRDFFARIFAVGEQENSFVWSLTQEFPLPPHLELRR